MLIGPTIGPNYSWISYDDKDLRDIYSANPKAGFQAGAMVSFRVQKRFFLTTSLVYASKGAEIKMHNQGENSYDATFKQTIRDNYIELPVLYTIEFKADFGQNKEFKWYFGAGPNVSYWLGGKGTLISSEINELNISKLDYKVVFNKKAENAKTDEMVVADPNRIQLGLNLAAGFVFEPLGYQKIMLLIRYELGHSFLSRDSDGVFGVDGMFYETEMAIRNQGFRVSLSYLVDLKTAERKKGKSTIKRRKL